MKQFLTALTVSLIWQATAFGGPLTAKAPSSFIKRPSSESLKNGAVKNPMLLRLKQLRKARNHSQASVAKRFDLSGALRSSK